MGDFFSEEYADKAKMLMDNTALLGKANVNPSLLCLFLAVRDKQLHPFGKINKQATSAQIYCLKYGFQVTVAQPCAF